MSQKRIAAIHDISGLGKCSLTVALPICSAAGIETAVIPTAVLSTHTGGFTGYTFRDLTEDILPIAEHWKTLNFDFDAVYTGYLGSEKQVDIVISAIEKIKNDKTLIICDPAMADGGKLYVGFPDTFPKAMLKLCKKADIIVPNITEAVMMLDRPFIEGPYTEEYITELVTALYKETGAKVVLTGVYYDEKKLGAVCFNGEKLTYVASDRLPALFHGTGDIFASVLTASLMNDRGLIAATQVAVNFTCGCIRRSLAEENPKTYGVNFEQEIPNLIKYLQL